MLMQVKQVLTPEQSRPLLTALAEGVVGAGLLPALKSYAEQYADATGLCARALYKRLEAGCDFPAALDQIQPGLPAGISAMLALGALQGRLDEVLSEILAIFNQSALNQDSAEIQLELDLMRQNLEAQPQSELICEDCFERELLIILRRVDSEQAQKVILQQEAERFLHQKYLTSRLVHMIEASHSKTYRTLQTRLAALADAGVPLVLQQKAYPLSRLGPDLYLIDLTDNYRFELEFRVWVADLTEN